MRNQYNEANDEKEQEIAKRDDELQRMRDTIMDMQQEYNRMTDEQVTNMKRQPSNLNHSSSGNLHNNNDMPSVKEQELTAENKFLKQRIAIQ